MQEASNVKDVSSARALVLNALIQLINAEYPGSLTTASRLLESGRKGCGEVGATLREDSHEQNAATKPPSPASCVGYVVVSPGLPSELSAVPDTGTAIGCC